LELRKDLKKGPGELDKLCLVIKEIPPSLNKYLGNSHNFNTYRNDKAKWEWLVLASIPLPVRGTKPKWKRSKVKINYYFSDNIRRDPDNYSGKFIMDGLKKAGIIADDSFKNVTLELSGSVDPKNSRTEIEVEQLEQ
jgi:Holliday junction resolvase RusA-like endonuclease